MKTKKDSFADFREKFIIKTRKTEAGRLVEILRRENIPSDTMPKHPKKPIGLGTK